MATPRLSIVIVNWNTRELLLRLLGQLMPGGDAPAAAEIIVVDNDSTDDSVAATHAAFPAVQVTAQPRNGGFAYGVNRGIAAARGEWILLLNTDTKVQWCELEKFLDEAQGHAKGGIFGPRIVDEHGGVQASTWHSHGVLRRLFDAIGFARLLDRRGQPMHASEVGCVSGCVFLMRRRALVTTGGLDERFFMYFEEADLCERTRRAGYSVHYLPSTKFVHAGGLSANQAATKTFLAFKESCLLYHAAWHGRLRTEWVRACLLLGSTLRWIGLGIAQRSPARRRLHAAAMRMLAERGLVGRLCAMERRVPGVAGVEGATDVQAAGVDQPV